MKRNERKAKLGAGNPTQNALHPKEGVLPNLPHENYIMKKNMKKKGKEKGTWLNWGMVGRS
jgi:hypothetical protein